MIKSYGDHAANERTFLAWVRTGLSFMGAGFVVEKFDLALSEGEAVQPGTWLLTSEVAGLGLIVLGVITLVVSARRYVHVRRQIASEATFEVGFTRGEFVLVAVLICVGLFLIAYVAHQLVA